MDETNRPSAAHDSPSRAKKALRAAVLARRDALPTAWREKASAEIRARLENLPEFRAARSFAAFWPIRGEVDLRPLIAAWHQAGKAVGLPVMTGGGLIFRQWRPGCAMEQKALGVSEPGADCPEMTPELLLVPLTAFDRRGGRLGYGKGFYDRAIAALPESRRGMTIGVAFAMQETDSVPLEIHDQPLDAVVTEAGTIRVKR